MNSGLTWSKNWQLPFKMGAFGDLDAKGKILAIEGMHPSLLG
jgi:hypothetical protein